MSILVWALIVLGTIWAVGAVLRFAYLSFVVLIANGLGGHSGGGLTWKDVALITIFALSWPITIWL